MTTPNEELTLRICAALNDAELATPAEIEKIAEKVLTGKIKAEDWYALIENSLTKRKEGPADAN